MTPFKLTLYALIGLLLWLLVYLAFGWTGVWSVAVIAGIFFNIVILRS